MDKRPIVEDCSGKVGVENKVGGGDGKFGKDDKVFGLDKDGKVVWEGNGKLGKDYKVVGQGDGQMGVGEGNSKMGVEEGSGQMGVDGKFVGGKDGSFLVDVVPKSIGQHEEVKGDGKEGFENAHFTNVDKSDESLRMLGNINKGSIECGGGEATWVVVEGGLAPCKTTTMVEEVGVIGKVNTKVGKS